MFDEVTNTFNCTHCNYPDFSLGHVLLLYIWDLIGTSLLLVLAFPLISLLVSGMRVYW